MEISTPCILLLFNLLLFFCKSLTSLLMFSISTLMDVTSSVLGSAFQPPTAYQDYSISNLLFVKPKDCFSKVLFIIEVKCAWDYFNNRGGGVKTFVFSACCDWCLCEKNRSCTNRLGEIIYKQTAPYTHIHTNIHTHACKNTNPYRLIP